MSTLSDALAAIKSIILIEERLQSQGAKQEKLSEQIVDLDRRLVRIETTLDLLLRGTNLSAAAKAIPHDRSGDS
jgi:hypothetical protein